MTRQSIEKHTTEDSVSVTAEVPASPAEVLALLRDPARQAEVDGSGMIRAASDDAGSRGEAHGGPLSAEGQLFVMEMLWTDGATRYRVENTVTALGPDRIEWEVADYGEEPQGWRWGWIVEPSGAGSRVTNYCDWSRTSSEVRAEKGFPIVDAEKVARTVERLRDVFDRSGPGAAA
ncbi:SRPBCC family protein [Rothia sp. AR01]|uniref:SRPBCC family protein n=1 Tax=Rothia santali TaxID=2949643 RepID=A0A9X2HE93_9MICC|nr:SRPBCC family protein [Rothia santali]MCP3426500.1 SRPBCC family protein [Rothia santali]